MNRPPEISFSFDNLNILGVFEKDVYVSGRIDFDDDNPSKFKRTILIMSKELFHESLDIWLKDKKDYCERYGEFCGVWGRLYACKYELEDEKRSKRVFRIFSFHNYTDMEHG